MIYKGQKTTPEFHFIKPIMESWTSLYEKTAEAFPQENKAGFTEKGYVSMLCAASWLMNIPAATEVPTKKQGRTNSSPVDILLSIGNVRIAGEAKPAWSNQGLDKAVAKLEEARKEASCLPSDLADHRLGVLFFSFWCQQIPDESLIEGAKKRFRAECPVGIAWFINVPKSQQAKEYSPGGFGGFMVFSKPC